MDIKPLAEVFSENMNKGIGDVINLLYRHTPDLNDEKNFDEFCKTRKEHKDEIFKGTPPANKDNTRRCEVFAVSPDKRLTFDYLQSLEEIEKLDEGNVD